MRLIAKFVKTIEPVSGSGERGEWTRGGMVVRTLDDNERLVAITAFGAEKVEQLTAFKTDDIVEVRFVPESREFGEKWYTDLRLLSAKRVGAGVPAEEKGGEL